MKLKIILAALIASGHLLISFSAKSQEQPDLSIKVRYHPYRQVADKYYSLQPIYDWIGSKTNIKRPMPEWIGAGERPGYYSDFKVESILPDGVLLRPLPERSAIEVMYGERYPNKYDAEGDVKSGIFLKNYPFKDRLVDNQKISFLALRTGNYQYTTTDNSTVTVPLYDYGIPYDPLALQAAVHAKKMTNSISFKNIITNSPAIGSQP